MRGLHLGLQTIQDSRQLIVVSTHRTGTASVAPASIDHTGIEDTQGAEVDGSFHVIGLPIPDVQELFGLHIEFRDCSTKDHLTGLGRTGFVGEHEDVKEMQQAMVLKDLPKSGPWSHDGVRDDSQLVVTVERLQTSADSRGQIWRKLDLHLLQCLGEAIDSWGGRNLEEGKGTLQPRHD